MKVEVIIAGGGKGERFGGNQPKQFCNIVGKPILEWSIYKFNSSPFINGIILVVPGGMLDSSREKLHLSRYEKVKAITQGGKERMDSVYEGLKLVDKDTQIVLVHDGVRPLVSLSLIQKVIEKTEIYGAAVPGIPVKETIKRTNSENFVTETIPRDNVYLIQTPQGFKLDLITGAYREAERRGWRASDDAGLVEKLGKSIRIIPGEEENIKITTSFDLKLAELLLNMEIKI